MREEALGYLNRVGIVHLAKRRADTLSGGESQRVAIARALMQRPRIVFADEPVASLDPRVGEEVMQLFFDLIKKQALTLLFVSHNLDHALAYSDRIIGLTQGRIELDDLSQSLNKRTIQRIYG
ncbi:MAG: ATP-binding cassette domain-containing protein [Gammaproteobacteria bacterium]